MEVFHIVRALTEYFLERRTLLRFLVIQLGRENLYLLHLASQRNSFKEMFHKGTCLNEEKKLCLCLNESLPANEINDWAPLSASVNLRIPPI